MWLDAQPCDGTPVDMNDVVHVHYWVADTARCQGVHVISSPDLPASNREPLWIGLIKRLLLM